MALASDISSSPEGHFCVFTPQKRLFIVSTVYVSYCLTCFVSAPFQQLPAAHTHTHTRPARPFHCAVFILTKLYGSSCCTTPGQRVLTLSIFSACLRRTLSDLSSMLPCDSCCSFQQRLVIKTFKPALTCSFSLLSNEYHLLFPL